eukprot:jgi/Mesvir1/11948/Mv26154-RA.1
MRTLICFKAVFILLLNQLAELEHPQLKLPILPPSGTFKRMAEGPCQLEISTRLLAAWPHSLRSCQLKDYTS